MKKTPRHNKKTSARNLYIAGISPAEIALSLDITERTIASYKSEDRNGDNDWDTLRAARYMGKDSDERVRLLDSFVMMMQKSVAEINGDETMRPADKAKAIASLGDAYAKMLKIAKSEDPEAYKLSIIKKTIFTVIEYLNKALDKETMERLAPIFVSPEFREAFKDV
jgi:hypothetical protein